MISFRRPNDFISIDLVIIYYKYTLYVHEVWIWWYVLTIVYSLSFGSVTLVDRTMTEGGYSGEKEEVKYYCFWAFYLLPS